MFSGFFGNFSNKTIYLLKNIFYVSAFILFIFIAMYTHLCFSINSGIKNSKNRFDVLKNKLDSGQISNFNKLNNYLFYIKDNNIDDNGMVQLLIDDFSSSGSIIQSYEDKAKKLETIFRDYSFFDMFSKIMNKKEGSIHINDINDFFEQTSLFLLPEVYNDYMSDAVNTVKNFMDNNSGNDFQKASYKTGEHLVGNTRYGYWENVNGNSVWQWYTKYLIFKSFFNTPYNYNYWYYNSPQTYYRNHYINNLSSKKERDSYLSTQSYNYRKTESYGKSYNKRYENYNRFSEDNKFKSFYSYKSQSSGSIRGRSSNSYGK